MLKQIIKDVALIIGSTEIVDNLQQYSQDPNTAIIPETQTIVTLVNFVLADIAQNFGCYKCTDDIVSSDNKIIYSQLTYHPFKIVHVKDQTFKNVKFDVQTNCINVPEDKLYFVEYTFVPDDLISLDDTVILPFGLDSKTLCYGVVAEYFALKMQYNEAEIWETKFKNNLKNLGKYYHDRFFAIRRWL